MAEDFAEEKAIQCGAGLPQRYLQTRLPEQIRHHFQMALNLDRDPVQLDLHSNRQVFDLTVITRDRTRLFADVADALAAWGHESRTQPQ